ncbi:MAG: 30S ribosomal protein S16 [Vicingaceae bacterium]
MPTKIRLQRHGKKRSAFYHIVIADSRAPRDGKFIEKIGTYNPNTNPATIDLSFEKALDWIKTGAQPTDTVRAILSYEGVLFKNHLDIGVKKGAFSDDEATKRFEAWKKDKMNTIQQKIEHLGKENSAQADARMKAEDEANKKREATILAKNSAMAEEAAKAAENATEAAVSAEAPASEQVEASNEVEVAPEVAAEATAQADEAPKAEAVESPVEESVSKEAVNEEASAPEAIKAETQAPEVTDKEEKEEAPVAEAETKVAEEKSEVKSEDKPEEDKAS